MLRIVLSIGIVGLVGGCAAAPYSINATPGKTAAAAGNLTPGMPRDQVIAVLGQPQGFQTLPNGIECMTYTDRETKSVYMTTTTAQDRLVILKGGQLSSHMLIQNGTAPGVGNLPGAPTPASECARIAATMA